MEVGAEAQVVIVGAGIAGIATSLGLHRLGIRRLVLESSDSLRTTGFAFSTWTNAWKALDALAIGDTLHRQHETLHGNVTSSTISGLPIFEISFKARGKNGHHEVRCVKRNLLQMSSLVAPSGSHPRWFQLTNWATLSWFILLMEPSSKPRSWLGVME